VTDASGAVVEGVDVLLQNTEQGTSSTATTNHAGIYVLPSVRPGQYRISVRKDGFRTVDVLGLVVNVQDRIEENFRLQPGSVSESITVTGGAPLINREDASVSTVVDRNFAENLPMNGRSFQSLIQLAPGVVVTPSSATDAGQFSVNGQRSSANYWSVDGVSANVGISSNSAPGLGVAGALGTTGALGGTNGLVSVDAIQEFRIQTSTYAPEFGRTPGGQISIVTRAGTNQFHGTVFDYFRNDALDANDWFADSAHLPKPAEKQNDFGGTFSGPIVPNRTFFFFSYEGLRLRLPQTLLTTVPSASARANAIPGVQFFLNAFPSPTGPEILDPCDPNTDPSCPPTGQKPTGTAPFNKSFSNVSTLDAESLRLDQKVGESLNLFARYSHSPSELQQRAPFNSSPSEIDISRIVSQTATLGATWSISPRIVNDFRFNYSKTDSSGRFAVDSFGGAAPLASLPFPAPFTAQNSLFIGGILSLENLGFEVGKNATNVQRQFNVVDNIELQSGTHNFKIGVDYRRLSPSTDAYSYKQQLSFEDVASAESGTLVPFGFGTGVTAPARLLLRNLGLFAQDTWRIVPRLTVTYGIRWDLDFVPTSLRGASLIAITNFNPADLSTLALAPPGTPPYQMTYGNVAPRLGLAYVLREHPDWGTVFRGGFGVFYDLASQQAGNNIVPGVYPFGAFQFPSVTSYPVSSAAEVPPVIDPSDLQHDQLFGFDPGLKLPYTLEWNAALEQGLGRQQTISVSYVGAGGRRLLQEELQLFPSPNFLLPEIVRNTGSSAYDALQINFQRRLLRGFQALASYTWAHSIDTGSSGTFQFSTATAPVSNPAVNRGPSDFDVRHTLSAAATYDIPVPSAKPLLKAILGSWSVEGIVQARTAPPVDLIDTHFGVFFKDLLVGRPDVVPGVPLYIYSDSLPGGKKINQAAFADPPADPSTGLPLRQGDLERNGLRGFGAAQWDLAIHRRFAIREGLALQFRAELFNFLNHPNFGPPSSTNLAFPPPNFGESTATLAQSLSGNGGAVGSGGLSPLYQFGGPRSVQLALKLQF
jgi:hypothetical protein